MSSVEQQAATSFRDAYQLLPGRAKRSFGMFVNEKQRLWLASDHLLVTTQNYLTERYKRFYLNDIQAITIQKSMTGVVLNIVLLVFAGIFGLLVVTGILNAWDGVLVTFLGIIGGIFLFVSLIHTLFGPTCRCHVLTAIHEEPLYCLGRMYTAQRVVEQLRIAVEGVQGTLAEHPQESAPEQQPMTFLTQESDGG